MDLEIYIRLPISLHHIGEESAITADKQIIRMADRLILPGVGKFDEGMTRLEDTGLKSNFVRSTVRKTCFRYLSWNAITWKEQ